MTTTARIKPAPLPPLPEPTVHIKMSLSDAKIIKSLLGKNILGESPQRDATTRLWRALDDASVPDVAIQFVRCNIQGAGYLVGVDDKRND